MWACIWLDDYRLGEWVPAGRLDRKPFGVENSGGASFDG